MDDRPGPSKVAIPKLRRPENDRKRTAERVNLPRVQKACDNCRVRKIKCSGERPRCQNCLDQPSPCTYPLARRDRLKDATEQIGQLVAFVRDLRAHVDNAGQHKIDGLLASLDENASETSLSTTEVVEDPAKISTRAQERQGANTEADVSGSVGSNGDVDLVDEDLLQNHESRATGFVGQNSEMQWFRSLKAKVEPSKSAESAAQLSYASPGSSNEITTHQVNASHTQQTPSRPVRTLHVSDSTFYLDGEDLDVDVVVDPYELPPPEVAEALLECYMKTVHTSFPILPDTFEAQFRKYSESAKRGRPYQVSESWQATLNLVLAIGAQYSHLAQAAWRADERDHLVYMMRAVRMLRLDSIATNISAPSLPLIQTTGLLSLYYLTIGRVSRAWMMIGMSLRFALAAGLHLRNGDPSALPSKKESLARTWWALQSIENLLCTLIGRPCVISNDQCTVPLPADPTRRPSANEAQTQLENLSCQDSEDNPPTTDAPFSEVNTNATVTRASYLGACVRVGLIMQKALSKLYAPQASFGSWKQVQKEIEALSTELDGWVAALPAELEPANSFHEYGMQREQVLLSFHYYSTKLLIYRPCLCRLERRIMGQSDASAHFNQKAAEACVEAAHAVTRLLPDRPNLAFVYQQSPWWCIVHNIMQAIAMFLLEMSFRQTHMNHPDKSILTSIRKLVRWLQSMGVSNGVAQRAYEMIVNVIDAGASQLRVDISGIVAEGEAGQGLSQNHSFQTHPWPQSTGLPPQYEDSFPRDGWEIPSFDNPAAAADFGTQHPAVPWGQQSLQDSAGFQPCQYFMPDPQMPSMFGNPFFTGFDFSKSMEGGFFQDDVDGA